MISKGNSFWDWVCVCESKSSWMKIANPLVCGCELFWAEARCPILRGHALSAPNKSNKKNKPLQKQNTKFESNEFVRSHFFFTFLISLLFIRNRKNGTNQQKNKYIYKDIRENYIAWENGSAFVNCINKLLAKVAQRSKSVKYFGLIQQRNTKKNRNTRSYYEIQYSSVHASIV